MGNERLKVLLADDDEDDRLFFMDALAEIPIQSEVTVVKDGIELLEYLKQKSVTLPNVVFLDLNMPCKGGIDCLREIRQDPRLLNLCVAIYSTSASDHDIEETFVMGANIYIKKPQDYATLKKILSEVLKRSWQYETSGLNRENFVLRI